MEQSLDDVIKEIQRESTPFPRMESAGAAGVATPVSAGVSGLETHLAARPDAAPLMLAGEPAGVAARQETNAADTAHLLSSGLSERQRKLPKIDYRMVGGLVAVLLLIVGVGSATLLTQESQELRQRAYQPVATVTPIPQFQASPTPVPAVIEETPAPEPASAILPIILGVAGFIGLIIIVAFVFWAFVV